MTKRIVIVGAGLAGLRLGVLLAHSKTAAALRKPQPPFPVNVVALRAAAAAARDQEFVKRYVREVQRGQSEFCACLQRLSVPHWPSPTNFVLADFGARAPALLGQFERHGILLRDRRPDFPRPGYVRITIGTRAQMRRVIRLLERLWLTATALGLSLQPVSQALQVPPLRVELAARFPEAGEHPQQLVRLGYAASRPSHATPRRALEDVLTSR